MYTLKYIMFHIKDQTTLVGATELRTALPGLSKNLKSQKIIIVKRGKPLAVLQDFEQYEEREKAFDLMEDLILSKLAETRYNQSGPADYLDEKTIAKKLRINL